MGKVLDKIDKAYTAKDNAKLTEVLEDDWAALNKDCIKPLQALIPLREAQAKTTFEAALARNQRLTLAAVGVAVLSSLLIALAGVWVARSITRSLTRANTAVRAIAEGDLSQRIDVSGGDEIAQLLQRVAEMQAALRKVVGEVRSGVDSVSMASIEIASGNLDLSTRTEQQASRLQQTAASMEQMTTTMHDSADNANQARDLAVTASAAAKRGGQGDQGADRGQRREGRRWQPPRAAGRPDHGRDRQPGRSGDRAHRSHQLLRGRAKQRHRQRQSGRQRTRRDNAAKRSAGRGIGRRSREPEGSGQAPGRGGGGVQAGSSAQRLMTQAVGSADTSFSGQSRM